MHLEYTVVEGDFVNAGTASSSVKKTLKQLNVQPAVIKRVVVALYEAEVNAIAHAYGGKVLVDIESDKIKMTVADKGPGIPDIALAMQEGYSTARPEVRDMGFGAGMKRKIIMIKIPMIDFTRYAPSSFPDLIAVVGITISLLNN